MIATDELGKQNMRVATDTEFARTLTRVFAERRPRRILETGTHLGTGTTRIIGSALKSAGLTDATFISMEVNPEYVMTARENAGAAGVAVDIRHGLSIPRRLLPTAGQIQSEFVERVDPAIFVDHPESVRVRTYMAETDFPNVEDDLLGKAMRDWNGKVDFMLLDSAGHMGFVEFQYVLTMLKSDCTFMLDDTRHVKHHASVAAMKADPRFEVEMESPEKFGFALARFRARRGGVFSRLAGLLHQARS